MGKTIILSIDAMGGINAPKSVIEGLEIVAKLNNDISFLLFGHTHEVTPLLDKTKYLRSRCKVIDCPTVVSDDQQPIKALKLGLNSSMRRAIDAVKDGLADACVSSGNTGALMVMSKVSLGMLPGIKRPAIVSIFPNQKHGTVMLDLGANTECDITNLLQFAVMGSCFARIILHQDKPTIGILNVGIEEYKGREVDKKFASILKENQMNYYGFVEGHDLSEGTVDVVVTDGFTGNVALKVAEGVAKTCMSYMKRGFKSSLISKIGALLASKGLKKSFAMIDPRHYNGAMFIGLNGIVVKSHGSCDEVGFANAVNVAITLVTREINKDINIMVEHYHAKDCSNSIVSRIKQSLGF